MAEERRCMNRVFMVSARRTGISPKGGALADIPFHALAAQAVRAVLADACMDPRQMDGLILGNALAAGGNPARVAALSAGLPVHVPAWSIDTQCCSGLDAIALAVDRVRAGAAHVLLAGGAESSSQAPQRAKRTNSGWEAYEEADFTPWGDQEPSMVQAARVLSEQLGDLEAEYAWAVRSHERAQAAAHPERISVGEVPGAAGEKDAFTRALTLKACRRAASQLTHNPTTMAPLADGAAMVLLMSEQALNVWLEREGAIGLRGVEDSSFGSRGKREFALGNARVTPVCEVLSSCQVGADPFTPGLATVALKNWFDRLCADHGEPACVELMESFAAQVLLNINTLGLDPTRVNVGGGLLAMGHPIGASGAVLAARLYQQLLPNGWGVALIPAAGGLASGLALRRVSER
jgi:acetyl-CoA C-acetyltransferase